MDGISRTHRIKEVSMNKLIFTKCTALGALLLSAGLSGSGCVVDEEVDEPEMEESFTEGESGEDVAAATTARYVPLKLYWSNARGDNLTTATAVGAASALAAGYSFARVEGCVFTTRQAGMVPLKLYWSSARGDNLTTATAAGEASARAAGYSFVRVEGYVHPTQPWPAMAPLKVYWSSARGDNLTTATAAGEASARAAGYSFVRVEGYVFPTGMCG
jgi:hypothetical protein